MRSKLAWFSLLAEWYTFQLFHFNRIKNSLFKFKSVHLILFPVFLVAFLFFFGGYVFLVKKLIEFIFSQDYFGVILATKLIQFLYLLCMGLSFISGLTPSITTLYLSKDLEFQFALPMRLPVWLFDRFSSIVLQSCGMILIFSSPFVYYFMIFSNKGIPAFLLALLAMAMTCMVPISLTCMVSILLVRVFPVQRIQQVFLVISIVFLAFLVLFFRYLEPEQFIGPGGIDRFRGYMDLVQLDKMAWNPGNWGGNFVTALSQGEWKESLAFFAKLGFADGILLVLLFLWGGKLYRKSWDRALYALSGETKKRSKQGKSAIKLLSNPKWNQEIREIILFFRDPSQWAQLFVLIALVALYIFSVNKLGESPFGQSPLMLAIGNSGFISFVALSIASRFVFTSFSMDGQALWILQTIPGGWYRFVRSKFLVFGTPVLFFSLLLQTGTAVVLQLPIGDVLYLILGTLWDVIFLISISTLMGMVFISPSIDNPLKMIISPGGILLMGMGIFFSFLHVLIRFSGQSPLFNEFTHRFGFPNLQDGREIIWSIGLFVIEMSVLLFFNWKATMKLQTWSE